MVVDPKESPKSKQPKLLLIFFLSTLPIVLLLGLLHYQIYPRLESRALLENAAAVRLVVRSVQEHFKRLMNYTEDFSRRPLLAETAAKRDVEAMHDFLKEFTMHNKEFDRVFLADPSGVLWADYPQDPAVIGKNFSYRDWYQEVSRTQASYLSRIYQRAAIPQIYLIAVASPVRNEKKETVAYLVGQYRFESLLTWLSLIKPSLTGSMRLIDHRGFLLRQPGSALQPLADLNQDLVIQKAFSGPSGSMKGPDPISGKPSLISYSTVEPYGWIVLASQPAAVIFDTARDLQMVIWGFFALFFITLMILGFVLKNQIRRWFWN